MTTVSLAGLIPEACAGEPGVRLSLMQQLQACAPAASNPVPVQLLRKYIAYAQTYVAPVLSAEAKEVCCLTTCGLWPHPTVESHMWSIPCRFPVVISTLT